MDLAPSRILPGAILISKRDDPIFKCSMGEVFDHPNRRLYTDSDLNVLGVLGECLKHVTGMDDVVFADTVDELLKEGYRLLPSRMTDNVHTILLKNDSTRTGAWQDLILLGKIQDRTKIKACETEYPHYSELWQAHEIYIDDEESQ